jgi:hypothetical protein
MLDYTLITLVFKKSIIFCEVFMMTAAGATWKFLSGGGVRERVLSGISQGIISDRH